MNTLKKLSQILILLPLGMFFYDLIKGWFVDAQFKIRSLQEWWMWYDAASFGPGKRMLLKVLSGKGVDVLLAAPAPLVFLVPPVVLYLIYRICFFLAGGKNTGGFVYKSRH